MIIDLLTMIFLVLLMLNFSILLYVRRKKENYTRERFAFAAVSAITSFGSIIIIPLLNSESIFTLLIKFVNYFFRINIPIERTSIISQTLAVIIYVIFVLVIYGMYKNWDGAISIRQYEEERMGLRSNLLKDSINLATNKFKNQDKLKIYNNEIGNGNGILKRIEENELAWHVQSAELLMLSSKQYKIDLENDWYSEYSCFISRYGTQNELIGIYCSLEEPIDEDLKIFLNFTKSFKKERLKKIIITIKKGNKSRFTRSFNNNILVYRYENEMLENLVDFSDYFNKIKSQYYEEILPDSGVSIDDIYVTSTCKTI